jgi:hypothetical protein
MRALASVFACLLAAVCLAGCAGGDTVSLESVAHAASRTESAGSARMAMEVAVSVDGKRARMVAEGAMDFKRARGWMDMDLSGMAALEEPGSAPVDVGVLRMLFEGTTVWMQVPPSLRAETGGKPWARMSAGTSALGTGVQQPDPASMLESLRGLSDTLEKKGRVRVRGAETTHYRAKLDMAKAFEGMPASERESGEAMMKLFGGSMSMPVDLYIDDADRVRRMEMKYELELLEQKMALELKMELFDFGTRVAFKRPAPHLVADADTLQ